MSCILNIETSTSVCSVALSMDGEVLFAKASFDGPSHAALLGVFVEEALSVLKKKGKKALDAVAVSSGPGSYTGLRIGVSVAKGLCFGFGIPLIGIHTLDIMAATVNSKGDSQIVSITDDCLYCAMLDARRMEVYAAIYDASIKACPRDEGRYCGSRYVCFLSGKRESLFLWQRCFQMQIGHHFSERHLYRGHPSSCRKHDSALGTSFCRRQV